MKKVAEPERDARSSGIGLVVTELALSAGARVSVPALEDTALEYLSAFAESEPHLSVFAADVTDKTQIVAVVTKARARQGEIGAVIACAGIAKPDYFAVWMTPISSGTCR
ncbi:SDR family NAD(P)-dependent oxidoreductase [Nocardia sp. NPDC051052]|uniref:SDR family NAD(P)-dependent oxidoreductase n=1 Tax=Nocardia sp. NPDC051052 TaxID=3364322 RepID=UPI0037B4AB86